MTEYPSGWTCELTALRLERYLVSALSLGEALAVAEHLEACEWCAQRLVLLHLQGGEAGVGAEDRPLPRTRRAAEGGVGERRRGGKRDRGGRRG